MNFIPPFSADLIAALDKDYPARCASKGQCMEDIMFEAGERAVVERLLHLQKIQNENVLNNPVVSQ